MKAKNVTCVTMLFILIAWAGQAQERQTPIAPPPPPSLQRGQTGSNYGNTPLMFEANQGQTDPQVKFLSRGSGYSVFLTTGGMALALHSVETAPVAPETSAVSNPIVAKHSLIRQQEGMLRQTKSTSIAIELVGAATNPTITGEQPLKTRVNYFIGRDPSKWRRNIPTYRTIRYHNVYPGIDLVYYGNDHRIEYDFDLAPGADAQKIQFSVKGADALNVDAEGNLVLAKGATKLVFQTPAIYQENHGARSTVSGSYVLRDSSHVGFAVGPHDTQKPLVIDPVLVYSTYLGGSSDDFSNGIAVDSSGDAYVVGLTDSPDFPLANLGTYTSTQYRIFLTEFDPTGATLLFADYFGGTSGEDQAYAIALDSLGNPYITGSAVSADFPVVNAYQGSLAGAQDAFLAKFSADGSSIDYSTYLGGSNLNYVGGSTNQAANSISVDASGEAVIAGVTMATNFPTTSAYQSSMSTDQFGDWGEYGFVTKFASDGMSLVYSTYFGGSTLTASCAGCFPDSEVLGVATDGSGNAYVTGFTITTNFPVTSGAFNETYPGYQSDVGFVSKFTASGGLAYSTYLGGNYGSFLNAIAVDTTGSAYVTGYDVANDNFPIVTTNICDPSVLACNGAVIAKLDPTGSTLTYSTFLGTSNNMAGQAIQVDSSGDAFIVGSDVQIDLANPIETYAGGGGDVVVAEVDPTASTLLLATFLGGQGLDYPAGLALDNTGSVYVTGVTESSDFPVMRPAVQIGWGGQNDAFVAKIDPVTVAPAVAMGPSSLQFPPQSVGSTSPAQTILLRNMGSGGLSISSEAITGDFAETDDCGATVAPASYCTVNVTFTPTASGTRTGAFTVSDDAEGSPHSVALTGSGAAPHFFTINPSSLNFPASPVGTPAPAQTVLVTNNTNAVLNLSNIQTTREFTATSKNCGSVPVNGTCKVQVAFTPASAGPLSGTLRLISSGSSNTQAVSLSGAGVDFVTATTTPSATVNAGETATYEVSLAPAGGTFSQLVNFSCSGAPALASCTVSPTSILPGDSQSVVTVSVKTAGAHARLLGLPMTGHSSFAFWSLGPMGIVGLLLFGGRSRSKYAAGRAAAVLALVVPLLLFAACGANGGGSQASTSQITPSGTYTLNVLATSGKIQHSTSLALTVR